MNQDYTKLLGSILKNMALMDHIRPSEIPNIDLYMDQVTSFMNDHLQNSRRFEDDKILTKTMINNYSKEGVLKPIKGKKYTKEHIIQMLLIYNMKNTLTIQEIKRVLSGVYEEEDFDEKALEECYRQFLTFKQIERDTMPEVIRSMFRKEPIELRGKSDLMVLLLSMSAMSLYMKRMAETVIDEYFGPKE